LVGRVSVMSAIAHHNSCHFHCTLKTRSDRLYRLSGQLETEHVLNSLGSTSREEGLWGVWETAMVGSHYELQKGGVFRAIASLER
jgi:hypothetical protein